jgi:hypothetical protein
MTQIREEVGFTKGRIIVRGKLVSRGKAKRADYILYYKPNIPIALIEAKDNTHSVGDGMQQGLEYAATLEIPFVFSSNGDGFVFHDRTATDGATEANLSLDDFPSPVELWAKYRDWKGLTPDAEQIVLQDYYDSGGDNGALPSTGSRSGFRILQNRRGRPPVGSPPKTPATSARRRRGRGRIGGRPGPTGVGTRLCDNLCANRRFRRIDVPGMFTPWRPIVGSVSGTRSTA